MGNTIAEKCPELAKEWHPTKNGNWTPNNVTVGSNRTVWWFLPYDDPATGKHFNFEWEAMVKRRAIRGDKCPYLSGQKVLAGYNDLATTNPELVKEWHPEKNGDLTPYNVSAGSSRTVWWYLPYDDPETGKHYDFEWPSMIKHRTIEGYGCPFLSGQSVWEGFNDLATTNPELAKEWHPTKNGDLTPNKVTAGSDRTVWWYLPYDDPETGKHYDFEWPSMIKHRAVEGYGCPYLSGQDVWKGFNDLETTHPELAKEWHYEKNKSLTPNDVTACSARKVWWHINHFNTKTNKMEHYEWPTTVLSRASSGSGCPYLSESNGEQHISRYLDKNKISYTYEKKFDGLTGVGNGLLSYDFCLHEKKILLEFNGKQHYKPVKVFGGEHQYKKQKEHDGRKRKFAKDNGYKLIEISYKYDTYEKVSEYLDEYLLPLVG